MAMSGYQCRDCGYTPSVTAIEKDGVQTPYLPVNERILWFNQWCAEQNKEGRMETFVTVQVLPGLGFPFAICEVKIFIDEKLAASDIVYRPIFPGQTDAAYYDNVVQKAVTAAKGRALANMGFNIPGGIEEEPEQQQDVGTKSPDSIPKAPTTTTPAAETAATTDGYLPARVGFGGTPEVVTPNEEAAAPAEPSETGQKAMTLDEAKNVVFSYGRPKAYGFTVGQLLTMGACPETMERPGRNWLEFVAGYGEYHGKDAKVSTKMPKLYHACQIVLDAADAEAN